MPNLVRLAAVPKYYQDLPHQKVACTFLGGLLLNTPARKKLGLKDELDWLKLSEEKLDWLQKQISEKTLKRFTSLWRLPAHSQGLDVNLFSQRDNSILPAVTCSSSSHAMYVDYQLRRVGKPGLSSDEGYLRRVFSKKYGTFGRNPSVSWDIQTNVCKSYGVNSRYVWNSDFKGLRQEVERNGCSVINIFHKGTNRRTRGGGHVVLVSEITPQKVTIHDPWGTRPPLYNLKNVGQKKPSSITQPTASDELDLLTRLVLCEARGEGILGMALVSRVVLNRLNLTRHRLENFNTTSPSLRGIIYAPWQFEPTWSKNNHIDTIYQRVSQSAVKEARDAISLSQNIIDLTHKLSAAGISNTEIRLLLRSTFFAARTHPQAIDRYLHHEPIQVKNQIFGEGKNTTRVPEPTLFERFTFKDTQKSQPIKVETVGIYDMSLEEFLDIRWQGCYRYLV